MGEVSAYDPSTWGDGDGPTALDAHDPRPLDDAEPVPPAVDRAALEAELGELGTLRESHIHKIGKLRKFIEAGEDEIERIDARVNEVVGLLEASHLDEEEAG